MATKAQLKRLEFIQQRLADVGQINRPDLVKEFAIALQTATSTFHLFKRTYPGAMIFCGRRKTFVRPDLHHDAATSARIRAAAPELLAACKAQHQVIDILMARLIGLDPEFRPSKSEFWPAVVAGHETIAKAEGRA